MSHAQRQWKEVASPEVEAPLFLCPEVEAQLERRLSYGSRRQSRRDPTTGQMLVAQATWLSGQTVPS